MYMESIYPDVPKASFLAPGTEALDTQIQLKSRVSDGSIGGVGWGA